MKEVGFQPLGLVMGSSIYHIGFQPCAQARSRGADDAHAGALPGARARDGAHGGRGRRARRRRRSSPCGSRSTCTRGARTSSSSSPSAPPCKQRPGAGSFRGADGKPFTSDLSGQDFWTLLNAGYRPLGFVMGNCVYLRRPGAASSQPPQNRELVGTDAGALRRARARDGAHAGRGRGARGAAGIVGVIVDENEPHLGPERPRVQRGRHGGRRRSATTTTSRGRTLVLTVSD